MAAIQAEGAPPAYPGLPAVAWQNCPIETTLGTLGRKWTLVVLRDIAFRPDASFSVIRRSNPGLLQRTLSLRLKQLQAEGLIERQASANGGRRVTYRLSPRGAQVWPILATLAQFGFQNYPGRVFADGRPRDLEEVFPQGLGVLLGRFSTTPPRPTTAGEGAPARTAAGSRRAPRGESSPTPRRGPR